MFGEEVIANLKTTGKKKMKAVTEIKKTFSRLSVNMTKHKAKELFEPISVLMRMLLGDSDTSIYLEALKLLKFVISNLAPHLDSLDLNILIGSFVGMIVSTVTPNMRVQM